MGLALNQRGAPEFIAELERRCERSAREWRSYLRADDPSLSWFHLVADITEAAQTEFLETKSRGQSDAYREERDRLLAKRRQLS
eukprot:8443359-Pyramimonas_sp.AAC.1